MNKGQRLAWVDRTCVVCGVLFSVERWLLKTNPCLYCSSSCHGIALRGIVRDHERRARIVGLYQAGVPVEDIASQVGITRVNVYKHLQRAGVPRERRKEVVTLITCKGCGQEFQPPRSSGERMYCSVQCFHRSTKPGLAERFWPKVDKSGDCWLWTGALRPNGYGQLSGGSEGAAPLKAHRVAYELTYGEIPEGMKVLHRCDNRACVRPDHLWLGTQAENLRDMVAKHRAGWQK